MSLPKTSRALKITMEPHRRHAAATDSCCCSGIHAGRRRRASSGANFAQFGTSPARTRCAMSIAFGQCAHPLRRQAHCQGLARTGWTVRPQSVPNRASARNRDNFADSDNLRLELVICIGVSYPHQDIKKLGAALCRLTSHLNSHARLECPS